jgi:hypothetical protein
MHVPIDQARDCIQLISVDDPLPSPSLTCREDKGDQVIDDPNIRLHLLSSQDIDQGNILDQYVCGSITSCRGNDSHS